MSKSSPDSAEGRAIQLEAGWLVALQEAFNQPWMHELRRFLLAEKAAGKIIYPKGSLIFNALNSTPLEQVKVVILGQDPYHGAGQAHGLSFSVPPGIAVPPSLQNIFKELKRDLNIDSPDHGCLAAWAAQGVLLLNTSLTVEQGKAGSHAKSGWQHFTDLVIEQISRLRPHLVFMLWGAHAQSKQPLIDASKHLILRSPHPSPLSAHRGFIGNSHFSRCNDFLSQHGLSPIDWRLA
ncbi:uracil-DNA glycosylase [Ventosimonas gracilis]|uniref:Uracil-DNA glycosylase n=1 Tax=Ventosimonas gracilis TaxID=1680762 RepID=A0A139SUT1_9GAMM|nr:uracil-DNA glycosylase [Ventosimonas gracilis]KXU38368.1 uracil-DNA glycosylase [Ventosimonas gracilis]